MKRVGILAVQGGYHAHQSVMQGLNIDCILVRNAQELYDIDGLILPGGESTTMQRLLTKHNLWAILAQKIQEVPVLATCAGIILLQKLGQLDIELQRNGYGSQLNSTITAISVTDIGLMDAWFIRAPIITKLNDQQIQILARYKDTPVMLKKNHIVAATFHPELSGNNAIHQYFLSISR